MEDKIKKYPPEFPSLLVNEILTPESKILYYMIGQEIIDIGFYDEFRNDETKEEYKREIICKRYSKEENKKRIAEGGFSLAIILEKQHLFFAQLKASYPKVEFNSNLDLHTLNQIGIQYNLEYFETVGSGSYRLFSAKEDPDLADDVVIPMIGKRIMGVDLIRVIKTYDIDTMLNEGEIEYRYCVIKLYLENNIVRLVGSHFEDTDGLQIRYGDHIDPERIEEIFEYRKDGFKI